MLGRALRRILGIELLLYVCAGAAMLTYARWAPWQAALAVAAIALTSRWGLVFATFALAWFDRTPRDPDQRIGPAATLRMVWREGMAMFWVFNVLQPFAARTMAADRLERGQEAVLLVHGYTCNRAAWWWLKPRLEAAGWCVATLDLEPVYGDIDALAAQLSRRIVAVCAATGQTELTLVAHSMGGLVARACLRGYPDAARRVTRVITLGTPHQGTRLAFLGAGRNARQMEIGNPWLLQLGTAAMPAGIPLISIYSAHDNYVMPQANHVLPGERSRSLAGVGHLQLLRDPGVASMLLEELALPASRKQSDLEISI